VQGKDELVRLMTDAAFGEEALPEDAPPGWRARLELAARLQWAIYRRHPWLAPVMSFTRPVLAYNTMAQTEWVMRAVAGLGFDSSDMLHIAITLAGYVRGTAASLEGEAEAEQETGITDEQWMESMDPAMTAIMASGAFPLLSGVPPRSLDLDTLFEFGLKRLLDGVGVLIAENRAPLT
jgi:FAD/FMN-containing dehydrogenase